jgi:hypothetical protein
VGQREVCSTVKSSPAQGDRVEARQRAVDGAVGSVVKIQVAEQVSRFFEAEMRCFELSQLCLGNLGRGSAKEISRRSRLASPEIRNARSESKRNISAIRKHHQFNV